MIPFEVAFQGERVEDVEKREMLESCGIAYEPEFMMVRGAIDVNYIDFIFADTKESEISHIVFVDGTIKPVYSDIEVLYKKLESHYQNFECNEFVPCIADGECQVMKGEELETIGKTRLIVNLHNVMNIQSNESGPGKNDMCILSLSITEVNVFDTYENIVDLVRGYSVEE